MKYDPIQAYPYPPMPEGGVLRAKTREMMGVDFASASPEPTADPVLHGSVRDVMGSSQSQIDQLIAQIDELERSLESVLMSQPPSECGQTEKPNPGKTPLAREIWEQGGDLHSLNRRVSSIIDRLAL